MPPSLVTSVGSWDASPSVGLARLGGGFVLSGMPQFASGLDLQRLEREATVNRVHHFPEIDSTNAAALLKAEQDAAQPSNGLVGELFIADQQTAGRGRGDNRWWSAPGALTFSLLTPALDVRAERLPVVSLVVGVAICQVLESLVTDIAVQLKWPNDVYLGGKKACGILIETPPLRPRRLVIGVGLNVNNTFAEAPLEVRDRATSLAQVTGSAATDLTTVLLACLRSIDTGIERLRVSDPLLASEWRERSFLTGKQVQIRLPSQDGHSVIVGRCESVAPDGALLVRTQAGVKACYGGEVTRFE